MTPNTRFQEPYLQELKQLLSQPKKIVITTHYRPDGDAMGSALAMYQYLIQLKHEVVVITPNDYPDYLQWLPGNDMVMNYEEKTIEADKLIAAADLIFCLDFNRLSRIESMEAAVRNTKAGRILIDHHLEPEDVYSYTFSYTSACSTCELVYQFIAALGHNDLINKNVADCIYTGIMTDTQSFKLPTVTPTVHQIAARLMEAGAENFRIYENVYESSTEDRLRLLGYCLKDKLVVLPEYHTAYVALSQEEMDSYHFKTGDTEGVVNYALSVKGTVMAAFFSERDGVVKMSFRSKGDFSVKDLSAKHFEGGGHRNASGGRSLESLEATVKKFLAILPEYQSEIRKQL